MSDSERTNNSFLQRGGKKIEVTKVNNALLVLTTDEAEPEEVYVNTLKLDGVRSCSLFIFKETIEPERPNWIDDLIEQKIALSSKSR